jgi:hypothetical protein
MAHQEATFTMWHMVIVFLNVDMGQDGVELQFCSILAHRQSTFNETITICHILHVAS